MVQEVPEWPTVNNLQMISIALNLYSISILDHMPCRYFSSVYSHRHRHIFEGSWSLRRVPDWAELGNKRCFFFILCVYWLLAQWSFLSNPLYLCDHSIFTKFSIFWQLLHSSLSVSISLTISRPSSLSLPAFSPQCPPSPPLSCSSCSPTITQREASVSAVFLAML